MANPTNIVWVGIGPGNAFTCPISSKQIITPAGAVVPVDLTKITLVTYNVYLPDPNSQSGALLSTPVSWAGTILASTPPSGLTPSTLQTQHLFAVLDCPRPGNYKVIPLITTNLGTLYKCASRTLIVVTELQL